ncbi:MAG TPA: hypothetical protein DEP53_18545 [Bacteroidetes bacterium]|nr:hypothetical protein [Bacteroidota bacterium]
MAPSFDERTVSNPGAFHPRFYSYLEFFRKNAVLDSSAVAYYEGGGAFLNLAASQKVEESSYTTCWRPLLSPDNITRTVFTQGDLTDDTSCTFVFSCHIPGSGAHSSTDPRHRIQDWNVEALDAPAGGGVVFRGIAPRYRLA